jgi:hypothetical protein
MNRRSAWLLAAWVALSALPGAAAAQPPNPELAARIAGKLAAACPRAAVDDIAAHAACTTALRAMVDLPLAETIAWGADQPNLRLARKQLTNFHGEILRALYLSLFWFDGTWTIAHDERDDVDVIRVGAYFRNRMPPGEFPYPFWHSAAKWADYERANQINFYIDPDGSVFAATRGTGGNEAGRGEKLVHQEPPAFEGRWQWTDDNGQLQPKASLFSNKYSAGNPFLEPLDQAYRSFALQMREGTCIRCHTPNNRAGTDRLLLLQTPAHAASAINDVLKAVRNGDMPQNDWGAKKSLDPQLRAALLSAGEAFSRMLAEADQWEAGRAKP